MSGNGHVGRNSPCPCGSGRKYKRCCFERAQSVDSLWIALRRAEGRLVDEIFRYAVDRYGRDLVDAAWREFTVGDEESTAPEEHGEFDTSFLPWFLFNWIADFDDEEEESDWPERTLADEFLELYGDELEALERRFIEAACRSPYSFYSVVGVVPGRSLRLQDVMTHGEVEVLERSASTTLSRGTLLYSRVLSVDGVSIMCGCAPLVIPPRFRTWLIEVRESLKPGSGPVDADFLHGFDLAVRSAYWSIADELWNPKMPELQNTDGEPLVPTELHYALRCTPREAFGALKTLALECSEDDLLSGATFGPDGELRRVEIDWLKSGNAQHEDWDTTVLGRVVVDRAKLVINVNSEPRARRIRDEVARRLGEAAVFENQVATNLERELEKRRSRKDSDAERRSREESKRLAALPEVQEHLKQMMESHWRTWFNKPIPALANQTPRQAASTPAGRERLEALLQDYEWRGERQEDPLLVPDVAALRRELGLPTG